MAVVVRPSHPYNQDVGFITSTLALTLKKWRCDNSQYPKENKKPKFESNTRYSSRRQFVHYVIKRVLIHEIGSLISSMLSRCIHGLTSANPTAQRRFHALSITTIFCKQLNLHHVKCVFYSTRFPFGMWLESHPGGAAF